MVRPTVVIFDESLYVRLRVEDGFRDLAPVVEGPGPLPALDLTGYGFALSEQLGLPVVTIELPSAGIMPTAADQSKIWTDLVAWLRKHIGEHPERIEWVATASHEGNGERPAVAGGAAGVDGADGDLPSKETDGEEPGGDEPGGGDGLFGEDEGGDGDEGDFQKRLPCRLTRPSLPAETRPAGPTGPAGPCGPTAPSTPSTPSAPAGPTGP